MSLTLTSVFVLSMYVIYLYPVQFTTNFHKLHFHKVGGLVSGQYQRRRDLKLDPNHIDSHIHTERFAKIMPKAIFSWKDFASCYSISDYREYKTIEENLFGYLETAQAAYSWKLL